MDNTPKGVSEFNKQLENIAKKIDVLSKTADQLRDDPDFEYERVIAELEVYGNYDRETAHRLASVLSSEEGRRRYVEAFIDHIRKPSGGIDLDKVADLPGYA